MLIKIDISQIKKKIKNIKYKIIYKAYLIKKFYDIEMAEWK